VNVRTREGVELGSLPVADFIARLQADLAMRGRAHSAVSTKMEG